MFDNLLSQEGAGEDIPIMLLANKTDKEIERQVQKGMGERLAKVSLLILSTKLKDLTDKSISSPSNHRTPTYRRAVFQRYDERKKET